MSLIVRLLILLLLTLPQACSATPAGAATDVPCYQGYSVPGLAVFCPAGQGCRLMTAEQRVDLDTQLQALRLWQQPVPLWRTRQTLDELAAQIALQRERCHGQADQLVPYRKTDPRKPTPERLALRLVTPPP